MKSACNMIKQLHAMVGTNDLSEFESGFVNSLYDQSAGGTDTAFLTAKQIATLANIYQQKFGD